MSALAWSPDNKELLVQELVPGSLETRLWRVTVDSGARTLLTGKSDTPIRWSAGQYSRDGRYVYALSDRESESLRVWKCDLSSGAWTAVTGPDLAVETFSLSPAGDVIAVVVQRGSSSELRDRCGLRSAAVLAVAATGRHRRPRLAPVRDLVGHRFRRSPNVPRCTRWTCAPVGSSAGRRARSAAPIPNRCRTPS
jgi:Tol biopolymer transport system component